MGGSGETQFSCSGCIGTGGPTTPYPPALGRSRDTRNLSTGLVLVFSLRHWDNPQWEAVEVRQQRRRSLRCQLFYIFPFRLCSRLLPRELCMGCVWLCPLM